MQLWICFNSSREKNYYQLNFPSKTIIFRRETSESTDAPNSSLNVHVCQIIWSRRRVYKHTHSQHPAPSPPSQFCFGGRIVWCPASGTRTEERFSNICAHMWPSWLGCERGLLRALRGWLHWAPLVSSSCRWTALRRFESRRAGLRPSWAQPPPPPSRSDTGTGRLLSSLAARHTWKAPWSAGLLGFQGNWGTVEPVWRK